MDSNENDSKNLIKQKSIDTNKTEEDNKILCIHCKRTKSNNINCLGMCVADSEY